MSYENIISQCLITVLVKHKYSNSALFTTSHSFPLFHTSPLLLKDQFNVRTHIYISKINITCIYTNYQPIFQGGLNPQHKLQNNNLTRYNNTCRPKQCRLRHSLDPNQFGNQETPPRIMPRTSAARYNHQECHITRRTPPDQENDQ